MHAFSVTAAKSRLETADLRALLSLPEALRARFFAEADPARQKSLGQFLTPPHVADRMAGMFRLQRERIHLLDAGAGMGILSAAFVRRQLLKNRPPSEILITAYEVDRALIGGLEETFETCRAACRDRGVSFSGIVHHADFIAEAAEMLRKDFFSKPAAAFDAAITNPPYGKLAVASTGFRLLRGVGAETTNLYTAFLNLIVGLLKPNGELVAITPRSFCSGPYFRAFRRHLWETMSFRELHVFTSRTAAFKHDRVLQENIILHAVKRPAPSRLIRVSESDGDDHADVRSRSYPANDIVSPDDPEAFIHIPTGAPRSNVRHRIPELKSSLADLGLEISTGKVVSFRAREHLRPRAEADASPLIHPCHFNGMYVAWPKQDARKPNTIRINEHTRRLLIPSGIYVLTRRFTTKEERRRVVACIYDPHRVNAPWVGLENHLNFIHAGGAGLDMPLAKGLWVYLNSTALDAYVRQFNGHTQVNATDLRNIRFPSADQLRRIGGLVANDAMTQEDIDTVAMKEIVI